MPTRKIAQCSDSNKPRNFNFNSFESGAHISVGDGKEKFLFHKSLLCDLAQFFRAALKGQFKEAAEATINMPEEISAVIKRFQLWAYTGSPLLHDEAITDTPWEELVRLCIFADQYGIPDLQNSVIDILVAKEQALSIIPIGHLRLIYDNTTFASPLRRLIVDLSAQEGSLDKWFVPPIPAIYPQDFLYDLALEVYKLRRGDSKDHNWKKLGCKYHVHPSTTPAK